MAYTRSSLPAARVAVIVLIHDDYAERYLAECHASLVAQTYPAESFTVFVVNNGVFVESRRLAARAAPQARFIDHATNLGWTGGVNSALRVALEEGYEAVALLNVDAVVHPMWLAELVAAAEAHPAAHIVQSQILLYGTNTINSLGNRLHYLGYGTCHGYGATRAMLPKTIAIDCASGAAMLVRREVFEAIGLFREDYFIYYDDVEFCWRARLAGFRVALAERAICSHHYRFQKSPESLYLLQRNRLLTLLTLQRLRTLLVIAPCLVVSELVMGAYFISHGWAGVCGRLLRYFARPATWRLIAARRREVRALRCRSDAEIVKRFTGTVRFAELDHPLLRYVLNPLLGLYWLVVRALIVW